MNCKKNGVEVHFGSIKAEYTSHVNADLWECPKCGDEIITGWGKGYSLPIKTEYAITFDVNNKIMAFYVENKVRIGG